MKKKINDNGIYSGAYVLLIVAGLLIGCLISLLVFPSHHYQDYEGELTYFFYSEGNAEKDNPATMVIQLDNTSSFIIQENIPLHILRNKDLGHDFIFKMDGIKLVELIKDNDTIYKEGE